jgi:hypothetical protein
MPDMNDTLALIQDEQREAGESVRPPATEAAIEALRTYARARLGLALPAGYVAFLQRNDGLDFNGTMLYGATARDTPVLHGFQQANELFRQGGGRDHMLFGETGDELFAAHLPSSQWQVLDRGSLSPIETYERFDDLLAQVLQQAYEA